MKKFLAVLLAGCLALSLATQSSFAQTAPAATSKVLLASIADESLYNQFAAFARSTQASTALKAIGPFTILATHNIIFRNMPFDKLDSLTNNPQQMAMIVKAQTVKGKITVADINKKLSLGKGKATLINLLGQPLILSLDKQSKLLVTDVNGKQARFVEFDIKDPDGVIHGIDNLLTWKK